jgi:hypothetical protein
MNGGREGPLFFPGADEPLRSRLAAFLARLGRSAETLTGFQLLLLGGGYGRGEGGVAQTPDGPGLYNDLEFYLFVRRVGGPVKTWIAREAEAGHRETGVEVEIKPMTLGELAAARPSMFYYDLLAQYYPVAGDPAVLAGLPDRLRDPAAIPADEAARLLMNRGGSLLRCVRMAEGQLPFEDAFVTRIAAKLQLALGDARLCRDGAYHWSCRERHRRLVARGDTAEFPLVAWHAAAVEFKLHPAPSGRSAPDWREPLAELRRAWVAEFLAGEARRLGRPFANPRAYAGDPGPLLDLGPAAGNVARTLRATLRRRRRPGWPWTRHPREAVLRAMVLLLYPARSAADLATAATLLGAPSADPAQVEESCRTLWRMFP